MFTAALDKMKNAFTLESSPYQPLVDGATSEFLLTPDWDKNGRIVDIVRKRPAEAADVVTAIRRRVGSSTPKIQFLALSLLEACFKQCGSPFRMATAANRGLLDDIIKIGTKGGARADDREAQEKALEILLTWRTNFRSVERYRVLVEAAAEAAKRGAVYTGITIADQNLMESERVTAGDDLFPEEARQRAGSAPGAGRGGGYPSQGPTNASFPSRGAGRGAGGQQTPAYSPLDPRLQAQQQQQIAAMIAASEVHHARHNPEAEIQQVIEEAQSCVGLLEELMTANASAPAQMVGDELCQHVVGSNRRVQAQILSMVESGWAASSEANFELLLSLNDTINRSVEKYEALVTGQPLPFSPTQQPSAVAPRPATNAPDLDDLFGSAAPPQQQQNDFDFFAATAPIPQSQPPALPQNTQSQPQPQLTTVQYNQSVPQAPPQAPPAEPNFAQPVQPVSAPAPAAPYAATVVQQPAPQPQRPAAPAPFVPAAPAPAAVSEDEDFDAFLESRRTTSSTTPPARPAVAVVSPPAMSLAAEDADFDDFLAARAGSATAAPTAAPAPAAANDDEEDFFQSRA